MYCTNSAWKSAPGVLCMRALVRACVCVCVRACVRACVWAHAYVRVCVHACVRARVCARACVRACVTASCGVFPYFVQLETTLIKSRLNAVRSATFLFWNNILSVVHVHNY